MSRKIDIWILFSLFGISLFSLFNTLGIRRELFSNQLIFFIIGFTFLFVFYKIGIQFFKNNSFFFYIFFIVLLIITFLIAENVRGSKRWIDFYFFRFQTSEFFKAFFLLYIADYFSRKKLRNNSLLLGFLIFFIPFLIIFKQPDLANALIYLVVFAGVLFLAGFSIRYFIYIFLTLLISFPLLWRFLKEYQKTRFISFLNPETHSQGIAYNLIQSVITVGSGGLWGRGLGLGTQSRFRFLPEYHTDFAYASLVEQFGMIGGVTLLFLYAIIIYRLMIKAQNERKTPFNYFFLWGVVLFLTISVGVNVGMNLGLLPVAGIALPLVSYGGSSIVSTLIMLGLALSI